MDRRRAERRRVRLHARLEPGGVTAMTDDASPWGVFLRTSRVLRPGTRVEVTIFLPPGPVESSGVVRWARRVPVQLMRDIRGGMGILFDRASGGLRTYLQASV